MTARHRLTEPVEVRMHRAKQHLAEGQRLIDDGRHAIALWSIMQAIINLERAEARLDAPDAVLR